MKQIFPKEIIESTIEVHRFKNTVKSKMIYTILLLSLVAVGIALPYVFLDIYSSARGIIKPEKERNQIISLYSGKIDTIYIKRNQFVKKGDTLLVVNNDIGKERLNLTKTQLEDNKLFIEDLKYLLKTKKYVPKNCNRINIKKNLLITNKN